MFVTVSRWESGGAVVFTCTAFRDDSTTARFVCSLLDTDARSLPPLSLGNGRRRHAQHEPSAEMRPNPKRTPHRSSLTHPVVAPPSPTPASSLVHQRPHRPTTLFRRHHLQPRHAGAAVGSRASTAANHVGSVAVHPLPPTAGRCACGGTGRNRPLRRRCMVPPPQGPPSRSPPPLPPFLLLPLPPPQVLPSPRQLLRPLTRGPPPPWSPSRGPVGGTSGILRQVHWQDHCPGAAGSRRHPTPPWREDRQYSRRWRRADRRGP